jgi:transmembrane sensor
VQVGHPGIESVERDLKWQHGKIAFQQASLSQWVTEFNRYRPRALAIDDAKIASVLVSGEFNVSDAQNFADALTQTYGMVQAVETADGTIHLRVAK